MAVSLFVFIIVSVNAGRDVIGLLAGGRIGWEMFTQLILLLIPYAAAFALPFGLLTSVLLVLGRMSAQNEITAMKASGISLYRIVPSVLLIAIFGILFSSFVNFYYSPMARTAYKRNFANILRDDPVQFIQPNTFIKEFPGLIIYATGRDGKKLKNFWIWELDDKKRVVSLLKAPNADFKYDEEDDAMVLVFHNAQAERRNTGNPEEFVDMDFFAPTMKTISTRIPMESILGEKRVHRKLSMLTFTELFELRNKYLKEEKAGVDGAFQKRIRVQMQFHEHFAMAFSILSLSILAIPLGIKANRSETYANLMLAVGLGLTYYILVFFVKFLEEYPMLRPDLLIWLPNIIFQAVGFWFLAKSNNR